MSLNGAKEVNLRDFYLNKHQKVMLLSYAPCVDKSFIFDQKKYIVIRKKSMKILERIYYYILFITILFSRQFSHKGLSRLVVAG